MKNDNLSYMALKIIIYHYHENVTYDRKSVNYNCSPLLLFYGIIEPVILFYVDYSVFFVIVV